MDHLDRGIKRKIQNRDECDEGALWWSWSLFNGINWFDILETIIFRTTKPCLIPFNQHKDSRIEWLQNSTFSLDMSVPALLYQHVTLHFVLGESWALTSQHTKNKFMFLLSTFKNIHFLVNIMQPCYPLPICHDGYQHMTNILVTNKQQLWLATQPHLSCTGCYRFLRQNYVPWLL